MTTSPISLAFKNCKKEKRPALITFTVAGDNSKKNSLKIFLIKSFPLTLVTAILFITSVYLLYSFNSFLVGPILVVTFVGLASLTFPHILLEYLIEKNEK